MLTIKEKGHQSRSFTLTRLQKGENFSAQISLHDAADLIASAWREGYDTGHKEGIADGKTQLRNKLVKMKAKPIQVAG